jgi:hypothetical protein
VSVEAFTKNGVSTIARSEGFLGPDPGRVEAILEGLAFRTGRAWRDGPSADLDDRNIREVRT